MLLVFLLGYSSQKTTEADNTILERNNDKESPYGLVDYDKVKLPMPDYLRGFMEFAVKNFNEYTTKRQANEPVDWRIKESLMHAIGTVKDHILVHDEFKG